MPKIQIGTIEQQLFNPPICEKIKTDYGLHGTYGSAHSFAAAFLNALGQTPVVNPLSVSYTNKEVFKAAVFALGSNLRKWSSFLANEPALRRILHGYDPAAVVSSVVLPEALMPYLPGTTVTNDSYAIIAWAHLLNAAPDYYGTVILPVAHMLQQRLPSSPTLISELLICMVGFFGTDPRECKVDQALENVLPLSFRKDQCLGQWAYTNKAQKQISRNVILRKWKFPGMRYALGAEFMRNLKWSGFKVDRHVMRLFCRWIPNEDVIVRQSASGLTSKLGASLPGELREYFYYSLLGMSLSPPGVPCSHVDNMVWALGAYAETKGHESNIVYVL